MRDFWRPRDDELWRATVRLQAESLNAFTALLSFSEVAGMARSVARYVWRHDTPTQFWKVPAAWGRLCRIASGVARSYSDNSTEGSESNA